MKNILVNLIFFLMVNSMVAQSFHERLHMSIGYEFDRAKFKTSLKDEFGGIEFTAVVRSRFSQQFVRCRLEFALNKRNRFLMGYDRSLVYLNGDQFSNKNTTHHFHFGHILMDSFLNVKNLSYFTSNNILFSHIQADKIAYFLLPHDFIYQPDIRFRGLGINTEFGFRYQITPHLNGSLFFGARVIQYLNEEESMQTALSSFKLNNIYSGLQLHFTLSKYTSPSTSPNLAP